MSKQVVIRTENRQMCQKCDEQCMYLHCCWGECLGGAILTVSVVASNTKSIGVGRSISTTFDQGLSELLSNPEYFEKRLGRLAIRFLPEYSVCDKCEAAEHSSI